MSPICYQLLLGLLWGLLHTSFSEGTGENKTAWACYGNFQNFLDISCPPGLKVELLSMRNGAKHRTEECPMETTETNFSMSCCSYKERDCVINTLPTNFPAECTNVHFCKPQSTRAPTTPICNNGVFPEFTHYTEITYRCIIPSDQPTQKPVVTLKPSSTKAPLGTTTSLSSTAVPPETIPPNSVASLTPKPTEQVLTEDVITIATSASDLPTNTTSLPHKIAVQEVTSSDDFTPAMIGGMIAGIVGLFLTVLIFMFYWGRKRQIRIAGKNQNSVWDFLLANSMSVRAFRGYDNFSSGRNSVSSEDSSPVIRKTVWLPNISLDSGHGESPAVTSDDNCSVVTVEQTLGTYSVGRRSTVASIASTSGNATTNRL